MDWSTATMPFFAILSVGLWTLRVALAARGRRIPSALVAAVEAIVFALVFSSLVADLSSWDRIVGYGVGVAVGTIFGLIVSDRLNPGGVVVEVVVPGCGDDLRDAFHARGWPATTVPAGGVHGDATLLFLVVRTGHADEVLDLVATSAPGAFWTTRPVSSVHSVSGVTSSVSF